MRGQRQKREAAAAQPDAGKAIQVIDVSEHLPRRIPSAKWRELIKKVWEADPLLCPRCSKEMRIVALIDQLAVIKRSAAPWVVACPPKPWRRRGTRSTRHTLHRTTAGACLEGTDCPPSLGSYGATGRAVA